VALPGRYTVKLTVNGKTYSQPLTVKMDPRVKTPLADLQKQFDLATKICDGIVKAKSSRERAELAQLLSVVQGAEAAPTKALVEAVMSKLSR
jgi:hypothetical protein